MNANLRHLRALLAVADTGSVTAAALQSGVTQPAVTQSIGKLEREAGTALFLRTPRAIIPTAAGTILAERVRRAFAILDPALTAISPRLCLTISAAQLQAVIALVEARNFTLAAHRLAIAQSTVHRAITRVEDEAGEALFERRSSGVVPRSVVAALGVAGRLALAELAQGEADIAELEGRDVGRIVIGAMPLSRSFILPRAIARFRQKRPTLPIRVLDGPYTELVTGLCRGEIDFLLGALRDPTPTAEIVQRALFDDRLVVVCGEHHPLRERRGCTIADIAAYPFVVAPEGTPTRLAFERIFEEGGLTPPAGLVETGSMVLMRELLRSSEHLGFISRLQIEPDLALGTVRMLPVPLPDTSRAIGLTTRSQWAPTRAQREFLALLEDSSIEELAGGPQHAG